MVEHKKETIMGPLFAKNPDESMENSETFPTKFASFPTKLALGECRSDENRNGAIILVNEGSSFPPNFLRDILIEYLPKDDPLYDAAKPSKSGTTSSLHSRTSSDISPCVSEDSMISDGQSSDFSFPSDLQVEIHADNEPKVEASSLESAPEPTDASFMTLRVTYLLVTLVIMLADGLQGTHLYVLYEGYGFSVAYLYCLGFATGAIMSPITGPLVDRIGRKKSAILYCVLEIFINMLEQYPFLSGLVLSRMIGGFTTNLLSSVFETWLDTEYRRRGLQKEKYEIIMRDSVIVSNMAAIFSGCLAHILAERYGAVGPFEGAVSCTAVALVVVCFVWSENYGSSEDDSTKDMMGYFREAVTAFREDRKMLVVGVLQGLTAGSIQIFVFLWAPTLRHFAHSAPQGVWGLDKDGEPAYGLIFGAFMCAGVLGGFAAPRIRKLFTVVLSPIVDGQAPLATVEIDGEGTVPIRPMAVEFLSSSCYFLSALLLFVPCLCPDSSAFSFSNSLMALLLYEFLIGIFLPCEGVIRSLYFPASARASIMTLPRIIVNVAVAIGVVSTNFISLKAAFFAVGCLMAVSSLLQLSLITEREWSSLFSRVDRFQGRFTGQAWSFSFTVKDLLNARPPSHSGLERRPSDSEWSELSDTLSQFDDSSGLGDVAETKKVKAE